MIESEGLNMSESKQLTCEKFGKMMSIIGAANAEWL